MWRRFTRFNIFSLIILFILAWYSYTLIPLIYKDDNENLQQTDRTENCFKKFVDIINSSGVKLFIIDPHRLFYSLSSEEKNLLQERNFNLKKKATKITTFGIFDYDSTKLDKASLLLAEQNFHLSLIKDVDPKERRIQNLDVKLDKNVITHRFYTLHGCVIHVVTYFQRSNYLWHGKIYTLPTDVSLIDVDDLQFGRHEGAFEKFEIQPYEENGIEYFVPENKVYFLFELINSRFLDCNFESTRNIIVRYRNISVPDIQFGLEFIESIQELKKQFQQKLILFWLASETLLGWYRQCSLIPYIPDVNLAAWVKDFDTSLIDQLVQNSILRSVYGTPQDGVQFVLMTKHLRMNLFFTYEEQKSFWFRRYTAQNDYSYKYVYPKFTLCSAELLYQKVFIPCEVELIITAEFGENWMIPDPKWHSPLNIEDKKFWTVEQRTNAFLPKIEH